MADANEMMKAYAADAVEYASKLNKNLDYSEQSIERVEELCARLHNTLPRSFFSKLFRKSPPEAAIVQVSKMLGGYVGEVITRFYGGEWSIEEFPEGNTIVLNNGDLKCFPVGKVYKRIKNGPEDNVHHFYQWITREMKNPSEDSMK